VTDLESRLQKLGESGKSLKIYKNADFFCSLKIILKTTWKKNKYILHILLKKRSKVKEIIVLIKA